MAKSGAKEVYSSGFFGDETDEHFLVEILNQITARLKRKYHYSDEGIMKLLGGSNELFVPVAIFAGKLSPSEALAKFLKEKYDLGFTEISKLTGRNSRSVWANYSRAAKKMPWQFEMKEGIAVPVSIFNSKKSILESLVSHLKDARKMKNGRIAQLLNKNPANIWTVYNRAMKKNNGSKNEN